MGTGLVTMAWLLLAHAVGASDMSALNTREFQIPITIDPKRRDDIREMILMVSTDQGKSWRQEATLTPDKDAFPYYAASDGIYWFSVTIVDKSGRRDPDDPYKSVPGQKILVDTTKPELRLSAERQGDDVVARWETREDNPEWGTLKLEYRLTDMPGGGWIPVQLANPGATGSATIHPGGPGAVSVRMQIKDSASNVGGAATEVAAGPGPATRTVVEVAPPPPTLPAPPPPTYVSPPPPAPVYDSGSPYARPYVVQPAPVNVISPPGFASPTGVTVVGYNASSSSSVVASSAVGESPVPAVTPSSMASAPHPLRGAIPPLQMVRDRQVTFEYEVTKLGPSGLGTVEVYMTRDEGRSWQRAPMEQPAGPAVPMDARGAAVPQRHSVTVQLEQEGIYGFYLVVKNGAGLGKPAPQAGEPPQIRIELDTTAPVANLFVPELDSHEENAVVLSWSAADRNLAPNPITLEWAERRDGKWEAIGADLPNTGRFLWKLPSNIPANVYLRLSVRDTAGNLGIAETPNPVLIDLVLPTFTTVTVKNCGERH